MTKYTIRVGCPWEHVRPKSPDFGWCRTLAAARKRAAKLSDNIRSDCRVGIEYGGAIIEESGTASAMNHRPTRPIADTPPPDGYHPVVRDGVLLGWAPPSDDYPISEIVLASEPR